MNFEFVSMQNISPLKSVRRIC